MTVESPLFMPMANPAQLGVSFAALAVKQAVYFEAPLHAHMILRRSDVLQAFRDTETYSNRCYAVGPIVSSPVAMDGQRHTAVRSVYNRFFSPLAVQTYEQAFVLPAARELAERLPQSGNFDLLTEFALRLPLHVFSRLIGFDSRSDAELQACTNALLRWLTASYVPEAVAKGEEAVARLRSFVRPLLEKEMQRPSPGLLGEIVQAVKNEGAGTVSECEDAAISLLLAGYETTNWMIAGVVGALLMHAEAFEKVRAQRELLGPAIEEGLRWSNVIPYVMRMLTREVVFDSVALPAGSMVALCIAGINHDPEVYENPERFELQRRPNHASFAHGPHYCVGAPLARMETRAALTVLFERFPRLRLDPEQPPEWCFGPLGSPMFGPKSLRVQAG